MHACYGSFTFSSHVLEIKMDCPPKGMVGFTGYCIIERCVSSYHVKVYPVHSFFCRMQKVIRACESICLWGVDRRLCLVKGVWGFWGPQTALFFKAFDYGFICMINVQYSTSMISPFLVSCIMAFGFAFLLGDTVWCLCTPDRDLNRSLKANLANRWVYWYSLAGAPESPLSVGWLIKAASLKLSSWQPVAFPQWSSACL